MSPELMKLDLSGHSTHDDVKVSIRLPLSAIIAVQTFTEGMCAAQRCGKG